MKDDAIQKIVVFLLLAVLGLAVVGGWMLGDGGSSSAGPAVTFAPRPAPPATRSAPSAVTGPNGSLGPTGVAGATGPADASGLAEAPRMEGADAVAASPDGGEPRQGTTRVARGSLEVPSRPDLPPSPEAEVADLLEHPEKHRGATLTVPAEFVSCIPYSRNETLRSCLGGKVVLRVQGERRATTVKVSFPRGLEVPEAKPGSQVLVRFRCTQGDLNTGNVADAASTP